jgi:hypothetical protein
MATATVGTNHVHPCHSFHFVFGTLFDFVTTKLLLLADFTRIEYLAGSSAGGIIAWSL